MRRLALMLGDDNVDLRRDKVRRDLFETLRTAVGVAILDRGVTPLDPA